MQCAPSRAGPPVAQLASQNESLCNQSNLAICCFFFIAVDITVVLRLDPVQRDAGIRPSLH